MDDLSINIKIINNTLFKFKRKSKEIIFGEWDIKPPWRLAPETTSKNFALQDDKGSPSGSEGKLSYAFGDTIVDMTFRDTRFWYNDYATIQTRKNTVLSNRYKIKTSFQAQTSKTDREDDCPTFGQPVSVIYTIDAEYPRHATDAEFQEQILTISGLDWKLFRYLSDEDSSYNSFAWSMGLDYVWINPLSTDEEIIQMYAQAGEIVHTAEDTKWQSNSNYVLTQRLGGDAEIDLMCIESRTKSKPTHAIRKYTDEYYKRRHVSTSKFGARRLAEHERKAPQGKFYGQITHSLMKQNVLLPMRPQGENNSNNSNVTQTLEFASVIYKDFQEVYQARHLAIMNTPVDVRQMEKLNKIIQNCDTAFRACFEERYACWKRECANTWSSNTYDYVFLHSFRNLAAMGTGILPLVVKKMSLEQNFHDLPLYESLQPDNLLCVSQPSTNAADSLPLEAEQSRARRTVHLYLKYLP